MFSPFLFTTVHHKPLNPWQVLQYAPPHQSDLAHLGVTWMIASTHVLRGYIRQMGPDAIKEAAHILTQDELQYLAAWRNPPAGVARVLSWVVSELQINAEQQVGCAGLWQQGMGCAPAQG